MWAVEQNISSRVTSNGANEMDLSRLPTDTVRRPGPLRISANGIELSLRGIDANLVLSCAPGRLIASAIVRGESGITIACSPTEGSIAGPESPIVADAAHFESERKLTNWMNPVTLNRSLGTCAFSSSKRPDCASQSNAYGPGASANCSVWAAPEGLPCGAETHPMRRRTAGMKPRLPEP
jgi:hypothetical protein